jgi:hypothetical protein
MMFPLSHASRLIALIEFWRKPLARDALVMIPLLIDGCLNLSGDCAVSNRT